MAEESKSRTGLSRFHIYERDPLNEPSMQMESMIELEDIDLIGVDAEPAMNLSQYKDQQMKRSQLQTSEHQSGRLQQSGHLNRSGAPVYKLGQSAHNVNMIRTLNQSLMSRESKDVPTVEQSNPRLIDETFKLMQKGIVTQECAENVEESRVSDQRAINMDGNRVHTEKQDTEGCNDEENIEPTAGNDESQTSICNTRKDRDLGKVRSNNRFQIHTGPGNNAAKHSSRGDSSMDFILDNEKMPATNRPYVNDRNKRIDLKCRSIEEFPFWEIDQKQPHAIDLSDNLIAEWPSQMSVKKNRCLEELLISNNYLNRIPGFIINAFSRLKRLDLRNNQIESVPTLSKRCSILRHLEFLDLGQNRLKLFPTSFIMSVGHGETGIQKARSHENSSVSQSSELNQNSVSLTEQTASTRRQVRLTELYLDGNQLESIPAEIADHENLQVLHLQDNNIASLPASIFLMPGLRSGQLGLEWFLYVDPPLKCPFPPQHAPSDTMSVFMDLALQMCEESSKICASGQVKFSQFVDYFSQTQQNETIPGQTANQGEDQNLKSQSSLELIQNTHDFYEKLLQHTIKVESHLKIAANQGHVGVIKSLLGSEQARQNYKEGYFRLAQRKLELFGEETGTNSTLQGIRNSVDELAPLAIALLEQQSEAAKVLIQAGVDQQNGYGSFGTALHLAVVQGNNQMLEHLLKQKPDNIDVRNLKFETPLHTAVQKLANASTTLNMIESRNRISKANLMLLPCSKFAAKIKHADPMNVQLEVRLKAIAEQLIFSGADLSAKEQSSWSFVHIASKSFSLDTLRWMLSVNEVLQQMNMETFDFEQPGGSKDWTPLHVASYTGSFQVIEELIERAKVDVFSRALNTKLPRQVARNTIVAKVFRIAERKVVDDQLGFSQPQQMRASQRGRRTRSPGKQRRELMAKQMVLQQKDWSRHYYRVGEDPLLYQQLMDQEPEQYALEKQRKRSKQLSSKATAGKPYLATNTLSTMLGRGKGATDKAMTVSQEKASSRSHKASSSLIQIDRQKYVSLSSTLRKCKAYERRKDLKQEQMFLTSENKDKGVDFSVKTMTSVKERELQMQQDEADMSVMSASSMCFSEDVLQEHLLMRAN